MKIRRVIKRDIPQIFLILVLFTSLHRQANAMCRRLVL